MLRLFTRFPHRPIEEGKFRVSLELRFAVNFAKVDDVGKEDHEGEYAQRAAPSLAHTGIAELGRVLSFVYIYSTYLF